MIALVLGAFTPVLAYEPPDPVPVEASEMETVTFTRLIVRDADGVVLGATVDDIRIMMLERMRAAGHNVRGAENVVFNQDASAEARFQLGGTLTEMPCQMVRGSVNCEIVIEWQLFDTNTRAVVYTATTRGFGVETGRATMSGATIQTTLKRSLDSLLARTAFVRVLKSKPDTDGATAWSEPLTVKRCPSRALTLPSQMQSALDASVVLQSGSRTGSGVIISPDGFIYTAAHVVSGNATVQVSLQSGITMPATVLRLDAAQDIAIVKLPSTGLPCLSAEVALPPQGTDVFAIGAPAGTDLQFSVAKGIVSGHRVFHEQKYLQTDASINPGNSGGPLVDATGHVVAIVSFKIVAPGFEGLGFGVPSEAVAQRLGMTFAEASTADPKAEVSGPKSTAFVDEPDESQLPKLVVAAAEPELPPEPPKPPREPLSPATKSMLGGTTLGVVGAGAAIGTWAAWAGDPNVSKGAWRGMQAGNVAGWSLAAVGSGIITWGIKSLVQSKHEDRDEPELDLPVPDDPIDVPADSEDPPLPASQPE